MSNWPFCLHPICRASCIQAVSRGLCWPCYTTAMTVIRNYRRYHLTDEQLVEDGKILERDSAEQTRRLMEYGERLDWFLDTNRTPDTVEKQERRLLARLNRLVKNHG